MTEEGIITLLGLAPLPREGGYYRETYRSESTIPRESQAGGDTVEMSLCTAIYYLLTPDTFSALHLLPSDEIFHFYLGDPVIMLQLRPDGSSGVLTLGRDIEKGHLLQVVVPKNTWQGTYLCEGGKFALMGTTVAPGFSFSDYREADRVSLIERYPLREDLIRKLTGV